MNRRNFLKNGALFVPAIFIPKLIAQPSLDGPVAGAFNVPAASGSCTTDAMVDRNASGSSSNTCTAANTLYTGQKLTAASAFTACAAGLWLNASSSPTMTLYASLWSHADGTDSPDTRIGSESLGYSATNITTEAEHVFTGLSASISNGQVFWLVLRGDNYNSTNFVQWRRRAVTGRISQDDDGIGSWTNLTTGRLSRYAIYKS